MNMLRTHVYNEGGERRKLELFRIPEHSEFLNEVAKLKMYFIDFSRWTLEDCSASVCLCLLNSVCACWFVLLYWCVFSCFARVRGSWDWLVWEVCLRVRFKWRCSPSALVVEAVCAVTLKAAQGVKKHVPVLLFEKLCFSFFCFPLGPHALSILIHCGLCFVNTAELNVVVFCCRWCLLRTSWHPIKRSEVSAEGHQRVACSVQRQQKH